MIVGIPQMKCFFTFHFLLFLKEYNFFFCCNLIQENYVIVTKQNVRVIWGKKVRKNEKKKRKSFLYIYFFKNKYECECRYTYVIWCLRIICKRNFNSFYEIIILNILKILDFAHKIWIFKNSIIIFSKFFVFSAK